MGALAAYYNDYLERFNLKYVPNANFEQLTNYPTISVTFKSYSELGHYDARTGNYTGILRALEEESDFSMCPVEMTLFSSEKECPVNFGPPALHSDYFMASVPLSDPKYDADPSVMGHLFLPHPRRMRTCICFHNNFLGTVQIFRKSRQHLVQVVLMRTGSGFVQDASLRPQMANDPFRVSSLLVHAVLHLVHFDRYDSSVPGGSD